jgi:hypothetical protein
MHKQRTYFLHRPPTLVSTSKERQGSKSKERQVEYLKRKRGKGETNDKQRHDTGGREAREQREARGGREARVRRTTSKGTTQEEERQG